MSREAGPEFLSALTAFVNLVLAGRCPSDVAPVFFGGRLLALSKKSGGFRPIVIGFTLRRLASKCANSYGINHLKAYFYPHQLGVGTVHRVDVRRPSMLHAGTLNLSPLIMCW